MLTIGWEQFPHWAELCGQNHSPATKVVEHFCQANIVATINNCVFLHIAHQILSVFTSFSILYFVFLIAHFLDQFFYSYLYYVLKHVLAGGVCGEDDQVLLLLVIQMIIWSERSAWAALRGFRQNVVAYINSIFSLFLSPPVTFLPEGVVLGFWNFA